MHIISMIRSEFFMANCCCVNFREAPRRRTVQINGAGNWREIHRHLVSTLLLDLRSASRMNLACSRHMTFCPGSLGPSVAMTVEFDTRKYFRLDEDPHGPRINDLERKCKTRAEQEACKSFESFKSVGHSKS